MAKDREEGNIVLGGVDNTAIVADISYEMSILMDQVGFSSIWEKISDEASPRSSSVRHGLYHQSQNS